MQTGRGWINYFAGCNRQRAIKKNFETGSFEEQGVAVIFCHHVLKNDFPLQATLFLALLFL